MCAGPKPQSWTHLHVARRTIQCRLRSIEKDNGRQVVQFGDLPVQDGTLGQPLTRDVLDTVRLVGIVGLRTGADHTREQQEQGWGEAHLETAEEWGQIRDGQNSDVV